MSFLKSTFNTLEIEIEDIPMSKADEIFPYVMSWMTEIAMGNFSFFSNLNPSDIQLFQRVLCENVFYYTEKVDDKGITHKKRENLSYGDLNRYKKGFLPLLIEFLEYNFGFFSEARRIIEPFLKSKKTI